MLCTASSLYLAHSSDFAYQIQTRPSLHSLRGYLCVHPSMIHGRIATWSFALRSFRLSVHRSHGRIESLSIPSFPTVYRLLATWLQSLTTPGTSEGERLSLLIQIVIEQFISALIYYYDICRPGFLGLFADLDHSTV